MVFYGRIWIFFRDTRIYGAALGEMAPSDVKLLLRSIQVENHRNSSFERIQIHNIISIEMAKLLYLPLRHIVEVNCKMLLILGLP